MIVNVWHIPEKSKQHPSLVIELEDDRWLTWSITGCSREEVLWKIYYVQCGKYVENRERSGTAVRRDLIKDIKQGKYERFHILSKPK